MKLMPDSVKHYKSTPDFTELTVPAALKRDHTTAAGVWAKINVLEGEIVYCITELVQEQIDLTVGVDGVIEPLVKHHVIVAGPVKFRVDFYR